MKPAPILEELLINSRQKQLLSQRQLSEISGVDAKRISELETGRRKPGEEEIGKLAKALNLPRRQVQLAAGSAHNPKIEVTKRKFRVLSDAPRNQDRPSRDRYRRARKLYPRLVGELEGRLRRRPDSNKIQVYLREATFDSALEYVAHLIMLDRGAVTGYVSPARMGLCHLPVVDPIGKTMTGHRLYPALGFEKALFIPQISLQTNIGVVTLDLAWGQREPNGTRWTDLEIDGPGHRAEGDPDRDRAVRMPVVRCSEKEILGGSFLAWKRCA